MANYRVGDYIRLRRKYAKLSQEELAFRAGVATETISRIENGRHKITMNVYKKIMSTFGTFPEQCYGICMSEEVGITDEKQMEEDAEAKFEYKKARNCLDNIKKHIDDTPINKQYIMRAEAVLDFGLKKINEDELLIKLEAALAQTVKNYIDIIEKYDETSEIYPFTEQEILILMNIADAYGRKGNYYFDEKIKRFLLKCIEREYMNGNTIRNLQMVVGCNLAYALMMQKRYTDALDLLEEILTIAKKESNGQVIPPVLLDIAWLMKKINITSEDIVFDEVDIKKYLRQTYYFAAARNDKYFKEIAENVLLDEYNERVDFNVL